MAAVKRNAILTCICMVTIVLMVSSGFSISELTSASDTLQNNGNYEIQFNDNIGTIISDGSLFDELSYNTQTNPSISFPELQSSGYGTTYLQTSDHNLYSLPEKQRTLISDTDTPIISSLLADLLRNSTSDDLIRVIITLREQPQFKNFQQIKEQSRQRILDLEQTQSCDTYEFLEAVDYETFQMRKELFNNANVAVAKSQGILMQKIDALNGSVLHRYSFTNSIAAQLTPEALTILESDSSIKSIVLDELQPILLDHSVPSLYADDWHSYGYDGAPWDVAILDTGVDQTHPALSSRVIDAKNFATGATTYDDENGHGTHVAGTVASTQSGVPGVAPGASIINVKIGNPGAYDADVIAGAEWAATGAIDDAEVINHSFGMGISKGEFIDAFVYYYDIIWVGSAGNDGPTSGTVNDVGYNMITVGNINDWNTDSRTDDLITSSSSRGPTWDGRIKPDLVAPGTNIIAPNYDWEGGILGLNPDYVSKTGTSMASPHVAGLVALLYDYKATTNTMYYKSLLMNTADDWGISGPDNTYGWGYANMANAYTHKDNVLNGDIGQGNADWFRVYLSTGSSYKATLVFERQGLYFPASNTWSLATLSDLDLAIYAPDGSLVDYSSSWVDNVEQVTVSSAPMSGYYKIRVYGYDVAVGMETYSLAHTGGLTAIYTPSITAVTVNGVYVPNGNSDGTYNRTESFNIEISVQDFDSAPTALTITLDVFLPDGSLAVTHTMPYNETASVWENTWVFGFSAEAGSWRLVANAEDSTGLSSSSYSFYITCENENPIIQSISLSSLTPRRVNETLDITVSATDYHNGTDLFAYIQFWMANGSYYLYDMDQNSSNNLFYYNLTLEEAVPLGFWDYRIWVTDNQGGWDNSVLDQFEVLTHQYLLTISSPFGTTIGSGLYDAGVTAYAGLVDGWTIPSAGSREAFVQWDGDASGTNHSQSNAILMDGVKTAVALWQSEYFLTIESDYGDPSGEDWYASGTIAYAGLNSDIIVGAPGTRYVFSNWSGDSTGINFVSSDGIIMDGPKTAIANWQTQYYLTIESNYGTPSGEGWYDSDTSAVASLDVDTVGGGTGIQYVFTSWNSDASGTDYYSSDSILMNGPKTATAIWQIQYYLTVTTAHGTPSGDGWYAADSIGNAGLDTDLVSGVTGERFVFNSWTDDASGTDYSQSDDIIMDGPKTAIAMWDTEYYLTVTTVHGTPSGEGWYLSNEITNASLDVGIILVTTEERLAFQSWTDDASGMDYSQSDDIIMDGPKTAIAVWDTEYYLTVTTVHGTPSGEGWYATDSTANAGLDTDLISGVTGERFVFQSWTDDASGTDYSQSADITMDGPKTAIAVWDTEYYLTVTTAHGAPSGEGWYISGSTANAGLDVDIVAGIIGEQFVFQSWTGDATGIDYSQSDDIAMNSPKTATAVWDTEYYLAVTTAHGTPSGEGWYIAGATAYAGLDAGILPGVAGERFVFLSWAGDGSGSNYATSDPISMAEPMEVIANWQTQYYLIIITPYGISSGEGWYAVSTLAYASVNIGIVSGDSGVQYVFDIWSSDATGSDYAWSDSITMDGPKTATAVWNTEYYLTVASPEGSSSGEGWYVSGAFAYAQLDLDSVSISTGTQFAFQYWTDDASGTDYSQSDAIMMDGPKIATAVWDTEYYLTITTVHGTPSGEGWYAADSTVYAALDLDIVAGDTGERFVFSSWTDDASGTDYSQSTDITMDAPKTATAVWDTEYYLTVTTAHATPSGEGWYAAGSTANASLDVTLISGVTGERFVFNSWTDDASGTDYSQSADITMDSPKTATAVWGTEYYLTVTTDHSTPSGEGWYVSGTTAYARLDSDIVAGITGERFVFQSWTDDGSGTDYSQSYAITMDGARTATAVWQTQYQLTCTTNPSGLSPLPTITPAGSWFNDGFIVILAAEEVAGYTFEHWLVDDVESGAGIESISLVMDEAHDAIAHYQVIDTTTTITDTTTTTTDTTTTTTGTILPPDGTMMLVIIGAGGVGVVIVILLIVMKKKS